MLKLISAVVLIVASLWSFFYYQSPEQKQVRFIDKLVEQNIVTRGGENIWASIHSLRLSGKMDIGHGMHLPYVLEQKRPDKMCLEFTFDDEVTIQCTDGNSGWKIVPFRGRNKAESMSEADLKETADSADLYGLLYNYEKRGIQIELVGNEIIQGRDALKLKISLPRGGVRWLYLDAETALEIKLESLRTIRGKERLVSTSFYDWRNINGALISHRQKTNTEGSVDSNFLTVDSVILNPNIRDSRFDLPNNSENYSEEKS